MFHKPKTEIFTKLVHSCLKINTELSSLTVEHLQNLKSALKSRFQKIRKLGAFTVLFLAGLNKEFEMKLINEKLILRKDQYLVVSPQILGNTQCLTNLFHISKTSSFDPENYNQFELKFLILQNEKILKTFNLTEIRFMYQNKTIFKKIPNLDTCFFFLIKPENEDIKYLYFKEEAKNLVYYNSMKREIQIKDMRKKILRDMERKRKEEEARKKRSKSMNFVHLRRKVRKKKFAFVTKNQLKRSLFANKIFRSDEKKIKKRRKNMTSLERKNMDSKSFVLPSINDLWEQDDDISRRKTPRYMRGESSRMKKRFEKLFEMINERKKTSFNFDQGRNGCFEDKRKKKQGSFFTPLGRRKKLKKEKFISDFSVFENV